MKHVEGWSRGVRVGAGVTLLGFLLWIGWLVARSSTGEPIAALPATTRAQDPQVLAFFEVDGDALDRVPLAVVFESGRFVRWAGDSATTRRYEGGLLARDELARMLDGIHARIPPARRSSSMASRSRHRIAVIGGPGASFSVTDAPGAADERWSCVAPVLARILSHPAEPAEAPDLQVAPIFPVPHD